MQLALDFGNCNEMRSMRDRLRARFGQPLIARRDPIGQLVKSLISGRTRDPVSLMAYERLVAGYSGWSDVAAAPTEDIARLIGEVTHADVKARQLGETLRMIAKVHAEFDLAFLGQMSVAKALEWLETMPGIGRKVSASTLNFSTLNMPAFVVDTHVLRVMRRAGLVRCTADIRTTYDVVMATTADWSAVELAEFHVFLKHLGQTICRADHARCRDCPIAERCKHARHRLNRNWPESSGRPAV